MKRSNLWKCLFNFKKYFSYSMLDTWHAAVHGVAKSQTWLGDLTTAKANARYHWKQLIFLLLLKRLPQSYLTLCHTMDCNPPGSSVYGILQAKIRNWVAIPSPGDLPDPGIELTSPALQADSLPSEPPEKPKRLPIPYSMTRMPTDNPWFSSVQRLFMSDSLLPHGLQPARLPYPSPTPRAYSNSYPSHWWCHPTISSSVA